MTTYLIDPLRVGTSVVQPVDDPAGAQVAALLCLPGASGVEVVDLPGGAELHVAGPSHFEDVRRLGEFRIVKADGSYRSVAGRGVVLGGPASAAEVLGMLASSGMWVSA